VPAPFAVNAANNAALSPRCADRRRSHRRKRFRQFELGRGGIDRQLRLHEIPQRVVQPGPGVAGAGHHAQLAARQREQIGRRLIPREDREPIDSLAGAERRQPRRSARCSPSDGGTHPSGGTLTLCFRNAKIISAYAHKVKNSLLDTFVGWSCFVVTLISAGSGFLKGNQGLSPS
jgi:hypothetical protein